MSKAKLAAAIAAAAVSVGGLSAKANTVDLTTAGSQGTANGAIFKQIDPQSTGTGVIQSFLRIQGDGVTQGYNTDAHPFQFDELSGNFTHSLLLSDVPIVNIGGTNYRQFLLDINQTSNNPLLSMHELMVFSTNSTTSSGFNVGGQTFANDPSAQLVYDLDGAGDSVVELNYNLNPGSGAGDAFVYIKNSLFANKTNVVLYSAFGTPNPDNDGFEEWAVLQSPTVVPVPAAVWGGLTLLGGLGVGKRIRSLKDQM